MVRLSTSLFTTLSTSIITLWLTTAATFAEGNTGTDGSRNIEVSYCYEYPNYMTAMRGSHNQYILHVDGKDSKFYSPKTEYLDSLKSTPSGLAKLNEMTKNAAANGRYDDIPRPDGAFYIVKSNEQGKLYGYETAGMERLLSEEPMPEIGWEICDSTKAVMGYECVKATADFHGRKWDAWFAPEIPVQDGPWKLSGLPGLILEAESSDGMYLFTADGIQLTDKPLGPVYLADEYEKVSRTDILKTKRAFFDNPLGNVLAHFGGEAKVLAVDGDGNTSESEPTFATREKVDFLETDY